MLATEGPFVAGKGKGSCSVPQPRCAGTGEEVGGAEQKLFKTPNLQVVIQPGHNL